MKADDLRLEEIISFSPGSINLHGRRLILHATHAFAQLKKDLADMTGPEHSRRMLTRFGYFWGQADAAAMKRIFDWDNTDEWLKAGAILQEMQGMARTCIHQVDYNSESGSFTMEVVWRESSEADEHLASYGINDYAVCWVLAGYFSGYVSFCLGQDIYFIETKCRALGDALCVGIGKDAASWGDELKPYLPYFQAVDIQGKIQQLTREISKRNTIAKRQRERIERLETKLRPPFVEVQSESFRQVIALAERAAPYDTSILITGESGTGKEVLAKHIHAMSDRSSQSLVSINCAALPETLLESELFGHKAGAFTGAKHDRAGLFEVAEGGTVFLDEVGDISNGMQMDLLRVLQEHEIVRVGENQPRKVDVRVIAATNQDLEVAIREGRFRKDLLYRLRVIEIAVPPLRLRREDILTLARCFVNKFGCRYKKNDLRLDASCLDFLHAYSWPGNVRELENAIERAAVICRENLIRPEDLPPAVLHSHDCQGDISGHLNRTLKSVELAYIKSILAHHQGNKTKACKVLGISTTTLWRKLKNENDAGTV